MSIVSAVTGFATTVCLIDDETPSASAVMVAVPGRTAVTFPKRSTVATAGFELRHVNVASLRSL